MYLAVTIDDGGFIQAMNPGRLTVHKETRNLHIMEPCAPTLADYKHKLSQRSPGRIPGILELTEEGGGARIWCSPKDKDHWIQQLKIWKGCYGAWPVSVVND